MALSPEELESLRQQRLLEEVQAGNITAGEAALPSYLDLQLTGAQAVGEIVGLEPQLLSKSRRNNRTYFLVITLGYVVYLKLGM